MILEGSHPTWLDEVPKVQRGLMEDPGSSGNPGLLSPSAPISLHASPLDSQETGNTRAFWHWDRYVNTLAGFPPTSDCQTLKLNLRALLVSLGAVLPCARQLSVYTLVTCTCFPHSPGRFFYPPRFIQHRPALGLSVSGPETLPAHPSFKDTLLM